MKLLSQNLYCFEEENYLEKWLILAEFIANEDVDIVCLQEVAQTTSYDYVNEKKGIKPDNSALFIQEHLKSLGKDYHLEFGFAHIGYVKYDEGLAFLSKKKLDNVEVCLISEETDVNRHTRRVTLKGNYDGVTINNVHFAIIAPEFGVITSQAFGEFTKVSELNSNNSHIIVGDFNIEENSEDYHKVISLGYEDVFANVNGFGKTTTLKTIDGWNEESHARRLDYVMVKPQMKVKRAEIVFDGQNQPLISDHFGTLIEFE